MADRAEIEAAGLLEGVEDDAARADRIALVEHLEQEGFTLDEMRDALSAGRLGMLPVERVLQDEDPCYSPHDISRETGLPVEALRRLWRALGLADVGDDEVAFTQRDLEAAQLVGQFQAAGLGEEPLTLVAQVLGQSTANLAETLREVVGDALLQEGDTERTAGLRWAGAVKHLVPQLTPLLGYLLAVHLREQVKTDLLLATELASGRLEGGREITVCFADLVGFTRLGERVPPAELSNAGRQLTALAVDAARPPVRLVKMIGDAAMLVSPEPEPLVRAALSLVEAAEADEEMAAPLRAGVATGQAVAHLGDWLGAPVNLASRVTDIARPGSVLATRAVRDLLKDEFDWSNAGSRRIKGVHDPVSLYRVRPRTAESDS